MEQRESRHDTTTRRRVVVTGLGMVSPAGKNVAESWECVAQGRSAVGPITLFDAADFPVRIAAEVRDFHPDDCLSSKEMRQLSRFVQLALAATWEAVDDAQLDTTPSPRHGVCVGVALGSYDDIEKQARICQERGPGRVSPLLVPAAIGNMASGLVAIKYGLQGPSMCTTTACASGTHAVGEAKRYIESGLADVMIAGGAEAPVTPLAVAAFAKMKALSRRNDAPQEASRPFDLDRDGFVIGEGAAMLILEERCHAVRRGARIYAELVGYGLSTDAHHMTSPPDDGAGAARAIQMALDDAGIEPQALDYINAHGTSTSTNDRCETVAIQRVLGEHATRVPVSSTKGVTGHCIGAAGALEAVFSVLAIERGVIPPTANYVTPDPDCPLDYVPTPRRQENRYVLSNSFGFGGHNATLIMKRPDAAS
jgi:3-oxoacyl-[acyl-carrier-protein] synthase II